ncbi:uncharacterized protein F4807DRAFT_199066 [Annulohypoxylon truncatum]|uniref:uncharacterized protein n=1 Tax=Annulohypoxylon truncatum TaxID=327061 RepID=UPI002008DF03|nr:uncharacterized protein F4807DRAFT_199066 [Annulohypoxylon truncatum]KAI1213767.1 hypothetical protein F4807DRAFT_199066 [Annulohypoxylon truncatum]
MRRSRSSSTGIWPLMDWKGMHNFVDWMRGLPSRRNRGYARMSAPGLQTASYTTSQIDEPGIGAQMIRPYSRATLGPPVPRRVLAVLVFFFFFIWTLLLRARSNSTIHAATSRKVRLTCPESKRSSGAFCF